MYATVTGRGLRGLGWVLQGFSPAISGIGLRDFDPALDGDDDVGVMAPFLGPPQVDYRLPSVGC